MLGAIEELRAKPIWSAAQRAQLAALSDRLRTATVAGETEQLRELLPRASQAVNALILAAQAAAQRRAATASVAAAQQLQLEVASPTPVSPNHSTGGEDIGQPDYSYQYLSEATNSEEILRHDIQAVVRALKKAEANPLLPTAKRRRAAHLHRRIRSARRRDKFAQLQALMACATREIASHKRSSSKRVSRARTDGRPPSVAHIHTPPRHILRPSAHLTRKLSAHRLGASGDSGTPRLQLAAPFSDTPGPFPLISIGKDSPITDPLCPPTWKWVAPFSPDWPCAQGDDLCRKTVWCRQGGRVVNGHTAWSEHFSSYAGMELLDEAYFQLTGEQRYPETNYGDWIKLGIAAAGLFGAPVAGGIALGSATFTIGVLGWEAAYGLYTAWESRDGEDAAEHINWIGVLTGFDFIQRDLHILRSSDASLGKKVWYFSDAVFNTVLGISTVESLVSAVRQAPLAWRLRNATTAEARLQILNETAQAQNARVVVGERWYRHVEKIADGTLLQTIEIPASALEGSSTQLAGGFLHEMAHVRQGYGLAHRLSEFSTRLTNIPGGNPLSRLIYMLVGNSTYILNPTELNAAASGIISTSNISLLILSQTAQKVISMTIHPSALHEIQEQVGTRSR